MKTLRAAVAAGLLTAALLVPTAPASDATARLTEVARVYSLGIGEVRCASSADWNADFASSFSSAYTNLRDDYTILSPRVCEGALGVGGTAVPAWQQALGALVLTHEAYHLRHWRHRRDEGKVECQALVYFREAAQRLGATPAQAEDLYAYALALHTYKVRLFPQYRDPGCVVPPWKPPLDGGDV
jgi:hypothetical protein